MLSIFFTNTQYIMLHYVRSRLFQYQWQNKKIKNIVYSATAVVAWSSFIYLWDQQQKLLKNISLVSRFFFKAMERKVLIFLFPYLGNIHPKNTTSRYVTNFLYIDNKKNEKWKNTANIFQN